MVVLVVTLVAIVELSIDRITLSPNASVQELRAGTRLMTVLVLGMLVVGFIASLFWVTYFSRIGYRALTLGMFPPPGTIVVRRTLVRTGRSAAFAGYGAITFAFLMGLFAILLAYGTWELTHAL
jgi:hypothetical protein